MKCILYPRVVKTLLGSPCCSRNGSVRGHKRTDWTVWGGRGGHSRGGLGTLTLTAALVGGQLVPRVTAALVAAQGVEAPLLTAPPVGPRALVHFCG